MKNNIKEQFNTIYDKFYPPVLSYFRKRISEDESEDLAQITFMKLWAYLPCVSNIKNEKSLIFSIAKNVYCDRMRQKKLQTIFENEQFFETTDNKDFTKDIEAQMVINSLSKQEIEMIELKKLGFSSKEIGKIQGVSASAIRTRMQGIRNRLDKVFHK
ncbi:MAG: RNA polymerase sigma factor [Eubacterium sp.]|nr:RNA polymerase sigma factor [Eubacterium sp.]